MLTILRRGALLLCTLLATVSAGVHAQAVCSAPGSSGSGTVSGIVNTYFQGNGNLAANATTLTLGTRDTRGASSAVAVGTLLLVIQMQDGSINSSNSSLYGDGSGSGQGTLAVGSAGLHEFVTVTATTGPGAGANVTFSPPLTNSYTQAAATGSAGQKRYQVIVVPQYLAATAAGVTAPAWGLGTGATGETGAVVAIDVQGALTLGSASVEGQAGRSIFVAGKGFRGAAGRQSGANGPNTDWVAVATGAHGGKGEGIAGTPRYMAIKGNGFGAQSTNLVAGATDLALLDNGEGYPNGSHARGAPANAGGGGTDGNATGGGNNENAGGGGGGGYAPGGLGGRPWNAPLVDSDGRGGAGYAGVLAFNRLFPGGGGGSGGSNDATVDAGTYENQGVSCTGVAAMCSSGAAGGGIVIVRARSVGGSGVIDARGANGYNVANDAGGGGGGGGAVVIYSIDGGSASVDASGGDGGNAWAGHVSGTPVADRHGPGGGGGGGFITFAPSSFVLSGTVNGGRPGRTTNGVDDTYSSSGYEGGLATFQTPNTPGILPGAVCSPDLRLAKSDGTSTLTGGGTTTYALTVSNIGNSITSGTITVVDVLPASLSIANGAVPLGGPQAADWSCNAASNVVTCTSGATIGTAATSTFAFAASVVGSNGTSVTNLARVGGGGDPNKPAPTGSTASACTAQDNPAGCATDVDTIQAPLLTLGKSDGVVDVAAGGTTTYSLVVTNAGALATSGTMRIVDVLPTGMTYTGATPFASGGFSCTWTAGSLSVSCDRAAALAAGTSTTISIPVSIAAAAPTSLTNRARAGGGGDPGKATLPTVATTTACPAPAPPATVYADALTGCASDVDTVRHVNLVLGKSDGQPFMPINGQTTYAFTVTNSGDIASSGTIAFRDVLPSPMNWPTTLIIGGANAAAWSCTRVSATDVTCTSTTVLAPGASSVFSLVANVGAATGGTQYLNRARIGGGGDPELVASPSSADATACTNDNNPLGCAVDLDTAQSAAQVRLAKSHADPQAHAPGDAITFSLVVGNSGGIATGGANSVRVVDVLPASLVYSGASPFTSGGFDCTVAAGPPQAITCNNTAAIAAGATGTISFAATVAAGASNNLFNSAQVGTTGADPQNATLPTATTAATCVGNGAPLIGCAVDPVPLNANLSIAKAERLGTVGAFGAGPLTVANGSIVQFRLVAANAGPATVANAGVGDAIPANFTSPSIVSATAAGGATGCTTGAFALVGNMLSGTIASLPSGASCTLVVQGTASTNGSVTNTAQVVVPPGINDTNAADNASSVVTNILARPTVQVTKVSLGGTGTFAFTGDNGYAGDSISTLAAGTPVAGLTRTLTAVNVATTITESAPPAGFALTQISCSGLGAGSAGIDLANSRVTLSAAAIVPGAAIACTFTNTKQPRITLQKALPGGRADASDQFALSIAGATSASGTTTGTGSTVTSPALVLAGAPGNYTLSEAMATGSASTLAKYTSAISCTNAASGSSTVLPNGAGTSFPITVQAGDDVACTLANTATLADLSITKTDGATSATPGTPIAYTIVAANAGPSAVTGASVTDTIPAGIAGASWTAVYAGGASGPANGSGNINASVNLPVGGSATFTLSGTIAATATGTLANSATIAVPANANDPVPANNSATDSDMLTPSANLSISKTDGSATYTPGAAIAYTIVASNAGPSVATGATVADAIPASIAGATWTVAYAGGASGPASGAGNINASLDLPVGGSATFTLSGTVSASATGTLANTATIAPAAGTTDPTPGNNSDTDSDSASPLANLGIGKTDGATSATPGSPITYTIVATNAGPGNVTGATVADAIPATITGATWTAAYAGGASGPASGSGNINASVDIPVGGTATFTVSGTISATATGTLANTATIAAPAGVTDPTPGNNSATDTDTLDPSADLAITKTDGSANATPGASITYTIVASNAGPSTATGATVTDAIPANITGATWTAVYAGGASGPANGNGTINASVTLPSGGTATFTVSGTISASATGTLANTATITAPAGTTDPTPGNNSATDSDTLAPSADIRTVKTGPATVGYGGALSYSVVVSNLGPSNANGATFSDAVPATITGVSANCNTPTGGAVCGAVNLAGNSVTSTITTLPSGASVTFTINGLAPTSGASVTNSATANPPAGTTDPSTGNNTGSATTNLLQPQLTVTKAATPTPFIVGQPASYTITVSNGGAGPTAGNITIADTLPAGITLASASGTNWSCSGTSTLACTYTGTIAAGGSTTLTLDVSVGAGAANGNNSATASGGGDPTCPAQPRCTGTTTVPVNASADIAVAKSVDNPTPNVGDTVTFTITATNAGPNAATGVAVNDALPSGLVFVSATPSQGVYDNNTGLWTIGAIGNGASVTLDIVATVLTPGAITNTATKSAGDQFDPNAGNNAGSASINAQPSADLQVSKTVDDPTPNLGTNVTYAITVVNAGPNDATNVSVDDLLPAGLVFVSATPSQGVYDDNVGLWTIGSVAAGDSVALQIIATVTLPGDITNTATVDADEHDPNTTNNTGGVTLNGQSADIQVLKGVDDANPVRGDTVTFTITATNNGPSAATGVVISDLLPAGVSFVSATPSAGTYDNLTGTWTIGGLAASGAGATATLTVVADVDTDSGFTNTASLSAIDQTDPNPANNSASVVVTPIASADLSISKTDGSTSATPGAAITYTIVAGNAGPSPVTGASIVDTLPADIAGASWTCVGTGGASCTSTSGVGDINTLADIPAGGSVTFIVTGTIASNATGTLANTATVAPPSGTTDPDNGNNSATDTDALNASANLAISKTDGSGTATPGGPITYTIVASNAGPSDANGVAVTDAIPASITGATWTCVASGTAACTIPSGSGSINTTVDLPAGTSATFTVTGTILPAATGTLANTATIAPPVGTTDPDPNDDTSTDTDNLTPSVDLAITKTDGAASATPGSPITYTIVASNAGPSTATNAIVADTLPAAILGATWTCVGTGGATCPASGSGDINATATIPASASVTFTVTGTVSAAASGTLVNTATVTPPAGTSDPNGGNNSATDSDTLAASANLSITKTDGAANATPGSPITYTVVASNAGPSNATGATVADAIPAAITGATWTCVGAAGGTCPASGSGDIAATVNLPVGGSVTFTVSGTISATATGTLANTATIAAPAGTTDPNPGDNSATDADALSPQADLMVSKTDGSASATPGGTITYTIVASNAGPSAVAGATVVDAIPASITGATWACAGTGGATCPATGSGNINATVNIPVGGNATFTVTGTLSATATGTLSNTATIAAPAGTTDPTPGNNSATDTDTLSPSADLSITKTDGSASATPGGTITYTIVASNAGPSAVAGATVADTIPATITGATWTCIGIGGATCPASGSGNIAATVDLPVGGNATFTVTGTVSASATGTLANTATIAAPAGTTDPTPGNNSATDGDTLSGSADIEAHKTGPANVTAGAAIAYGVVVTNHGPSDANAATFNDAVPSGITGVTASCGTPTGGAVCGAVNVAGNTVTSTITTLPSGASVTFSISGTAPADPGSLSNTASAQPPAGIADPAPGNNSSSVTTAVDAAADVAIVKTGPSTIASGAPISYTLVVSNAGPSAADGATYADSVPAAITGIVASCGSPSGGASCAPPTLAGNDVSGSVPVLPAGGSVTITISGTAPFGTQSFTNTATATGPVGVPDPDAANNSASVTTSIGAAADIALTKTVDDTAPNVGETVTFTITASNAGPNDASGVAVTDSLPFGFSLVSATPSVGTYVPATGQWTIGALANGASETLLIVASIDIPGALTNTVAVSASDQPDPDTSNNVAGASVNAGASADVAVAKGVDDTTPNVGATIIYTITASNGGPNDATGVEITDNLPAGTTFVSATASQGTYAGGVWSVGALANGASATLAISATVEAPGSIVNTATITHEDQFDPVGANNQAGVTINGQQADLGVTKTVDDAAPDVGDSVTFTVTVHNNGPSDATGVAVSDALPPGLVSISATPSQGAYDNLSGTWAVGTLAAAGPGSSAILTIVADVATAGPMTNTASVSASDQPDPNGANNSASASLNGNPLADLAVAKSGPATVVPGDDAVYTIVVTNNGPSDASNVVVVDPTPAGLAFVSNAGACATTYPCTLPSLASGASATITTTYTVPADYAGANPIVNTASASATEPDPDTANNQSSASTGVGAGNADLSIVKTGPAAVASDGAIAYTLLITNNGPSPANGASYSDSVPAGIGAIVAACGGEAGGAACGTQPSVVGNTVTGTIGNLPSGGSVLVTIDGTAPTGPVTLSNTAIVAPPAGVNDPNPGDNSSTVVTDVSSASADLAIVKTGPANAVEGGSVTYTLTVTNNGPDVAMATQISDPTPAGLAFVSASLPCAGGFPCVLGDLAPGASTIVSVTYTVGSGVTGSVTNTATVGSSTPDPDGANNSSGVTTPIVSAATSADLVLAKSGPATATPGTNVTYALQVQNAGPDTALDVVLDDPTPANLAFVSASAPCAAGFPCSLGSLASGAGTFVTVTYAVAPGASGAVTNSASVASTTPDPDLGNNASSVTTPLVVVATSADLAIAKSGPASVAPGDTIAYTVVVTNNGPDAAANVVVDDATPPGLVFVGNAGACASAYPCVLGSLASGASAAITSTYLVPASYAGANPVVNVAGVVADTPDPDGTDNVASASTLVVAPVVAADLRIAKSGPARADAGSEVTYSIVVTNDGPDAVSDAVLTDPTPAGLVFMSADAPCSGGFPCMLPALGSGESTTVTATYFVQATFAGSIRNVASVASPSVIDLTPNNNASTATTVVTGAPAAPTNVPVDARWMLLMMSALLLLAGSAAGRRRR
ncbi:DUF7507 domain-containing protein [Dokdonella sp.]|uniref:DUF7507 domain-containing protein n=1 Tax=Dokdonella sp. TaxID=2291710 RepID=UPI002F40BF90